MPIDDAGHGVDVNVGSCRCPGGSPTPQHPDGDIVTLVPKLTLPMAAALKTRTMADQLGDDSIAAVQFSLVSGYLRAAPYGAIASWSFIEEGEPDKRGNPTTVPVPITPENIERLLPYADGGLEVAEAADRLYSNEVLRPLRRRSPELFQTSPTVLSTPAILGSGSTRPTHSGRSSRNGTAGKRSGR